jgi:hypothetical protein
VFAAELALMTPGVVAVELLDRYELDSRRLVATDDVVCARRASLRQDSVVDCGVELTRSLVPGRPGPRAGELARGGRRSAGRARSTA